MENQIYKGSGLPHDAIERLPSPPPGRIGSLSTRVLTIPVSRTEIESVNAALLLRRPLLVTGWSGAGLSTPAYRVAHELKLGTVLVWHITRYSTIKEGLYFYDEESRKQDAMFRDRIPDIENYFKLGPLGTALFPASKPRVLLIDGIDKGSNELLEDLLLILTSGEFEIPELARHNQDLIHVRTYDGHDFAVISRGRIRCDSLPFTVLTSHGEKSLPESLVTRCVLLQIEYPNQHTWLEIIKSQFGSATPSDLIIHRIIDQVSENRHFTVDQVLDAVYLAAHSTEQPLELDLLKHDIANLMTVAATTPQKSETIKSEIVPTNVKRYDIFLSYATGDSGVAGELKTELERKGLSCFMAEKDISVATEWEISIREALISSKWVLLLLTPRSLNRPWVLLESGAAWALGKSIVPVLVHVSPNDLIDPIRKYQARVVETSAQQKSLIEELSRA